MTQIFSRQQHLKTHDSHEKSDVCLSQLISDEVVLSVQDFFQTIQRGKQFCHRLGIRLLTGSETGTIDTIWNARITLDFRVLLLPPNLFPFANGIFAGADGKAEGLLGWTLGDALRISRSSRKAGAADFSSALAVVPVAPPRRRGDFTCSPSRVHSFTSPTSFLE